MVSASKRVKKKSLRKGRRSGSSPTNPSSSSQDLPDKPKRGSFWKRIGRRSTTGSGLRRTNSLKRVSSSPEARFRRPLSPKFSSPPFDFRNPSDHSSSHSSSPASSPSSPSTQYRPGSLQGLIPKLRAVRSPRRKTSAHGPVPVSPLARTPSPTSCSPSHGHAPRSTSPLTVKTSSASPHFVSITPSTSPRTETPLLRRALSPELKMKFDSKAVGDIPSRAKEEKSSDQNS